MKIDILTLFPEMFAPLSESIIGRAAAAGKVVINVTDIRNYSEDKHNKCDDYTFGGGAGMLMLPQPVVSAFEAVDPHREAYRIYMSPKGRRFEQKMISELISRERVVLLCGHYEGVDQRALDMCIDDEISVGDYVLTGGELPAMVVTDAVCRYLDGVISSESLSDESFTGDLLEYPQYTRPRVFRGISVPEVLLSGDHAAVDKWRLEQAEKLTAEKRPDLMRKYVRAVNRKRTQAEQIKAAEKAARTSDGKSLKDAENAKKGCGAESDVDGDGNIKCADKE